jgi:hypothetical protein
MRLPGRQTTSKDPSHTSTGCDGQVWVLTDTLPDEPMNPIRPGLARQ